jgi:hypothetical protein
VLCVAAASALFVAAQPALAQTRYWSFEVLGVTPVADGAHAIRLRPLPSGTEFPQKCDPLRILARYDLSEWSTAGRREVTHDGHDRSLTLLRQAQVTGAIVQLGVLGEGFGADSEATVCDVVSRGLSVVVDPVGSPVILSVFVEPSIGGGAPDGR